MVLKMSNQLSTSQQQVAGLKLTKQVPFSHLIAIIIPQLDKDRAMLLHSLYLKLKETEISKDVFVQQLRGIVGDEMLKLSVHKLQSQAAKHAQGSAVQTQSELEAATSAQGSAIQSQPVSEVLAQQRQTSNASLVMGCQEDVQKIHATKASKKTQSKKGSYGPQSSPTYTRDAPPGSLVAPAALKPTTLSGHKRLYSSPIVDDLAGRKCFVVKDIPAVDLPPPPPALTPAAAESTHAGGYTLTHTMVVESFANLGPNLHMEQFGKSMGDDQLSSHVSLMSSGFKGMAQALVNMANDLETTKKMYEEKAQKMTDSYTQLVLICDQYRKAATNAEREGSRMGLVLEAYKERAKKIEDEVVELKHQLVDARAALDTAEEVGYIRGISAELTDEQKENLVREFFSLVPSNK